MTMEAVAPVEKEEPHYEDEIAACDSNFRQMTEVIKKQHGYVVDIPTLGRAYEMAKELHGDTRRHSGELYLRHPLAVTEELSSLRCRTSILVAAMLHDTLEDCSDQITFEKIRESFTLEIAEIVSGVTAIKAEEKRIDERFNEMTPAEQHDFLDTLTDAKLIQSRYQREVFLVRFADRCHNLSTLDACDVASRKKKIASTRAFLIPAAKRLGMRYYEVMLSDLCMKYDGDNYYSNESVWLLQERTRQTSCCSETYNEFVSSLKEAVKKQDIFAFPAYNPFSRFRGGKRDGREEFSILERRLLRASELKEQLGDGKRLDRATMDFNEIIMTCKSNEKAKILSAFIRFHADELKKRHIFFQYTGETESAVILRLTDMVENNYRLVLVPENRLDEYFIGNANGDKLTIMNEEAPADALRPQITVYTYTVSVKDGRDLYRLYLRCVPKGSTALDFAFQINPTLALTCKSVKIHSWNGGRPAPFTEDDYCYPLSTPLNDNDVVHFEADYVSGDPSKNINHAVIDWFAFINTDNAKRRLIQFLKG